MNLSLSNTLGNGGVLGIDPDAKAYIDAVVAAGTTVSGVQKSAINTFVKTGKADGWYSSIKRLYLPIWAAALPNAICMKSLTSGTFNGTVTHAAGYIQGNGTTGYLDTNTNFVTQGLSASNGLMFALTIADASQTFDRYLGAGNGVNEASLLQESPTSIVDRYLGPALFSGQQVLTVTNGTGVIASSRVSGTRRLSLRKTAGITQVSRTNADFGTIQSSNVFAMALNNSNSGSTPESASNARFGAVGFGLGLTAADTNAFTLALKILWETTTGLTLP